MMKDPPKIAMKKAIHYTTFGILAAKITSSINYNNMEHWYIDTLIAPFPYITAVVKNKAAITCIVPIAAQAINSAAEGL